MPKKKKTRPRETKFKIDDIVTHRKGGRRRFQVVEVLYSVPLGGPSLYGRVEVRRYAEDDLAPEHEVEQTT
jgi:hypothetical protein